MAGSVEHRQRLARLRAQLRNLEALRDALGDERIEQSAAPLRALIADLEARLHTGGGAVGVGFETRRPRMDE